MSGQTFYFYGGIHSHYYFQLTLNPKKGGTMIDKDDIKSKDFSEVLPQRIAKLQFVSSTLKGMGYDDQGHFRNLLNDFYMGMGLVIEDVIKDLEAIIQALYRGEKGGVHGSD